jgi:nitroreductase
MDLEEFAGLVRQRRTSMVVDRDRAVPAELVERLCELAQWAPNHKRTWPARYCLFVGDGRARLGEALADDMTERNFGDEGKWAKTRTKYLRTPAVLVVGVAPHPNPTIHDENRDAVAAGIQNLLLGATVAGLASYWSTPGLIDGPRALALAGFGPDDRIAAVIYLGWPAGPVETPARPDPDLRVVQ